MNHRRERPARIVRSRVARALALLFIVGAAVASAADERRPLLWQVDGHERSVFLYGSIHVAPPDVIPPPVVVREAFDRSGVLVTEILIDEGLDRALQAALATRMFTEDAEIPDLVEPEIWNQIRSWGAQNGVPPDILRTMQPWAVDMLINEHAAMPPGFSPDHGLDAYFAGKAGARGMPTMGLESMEDQLDLLAGGTIAEQIESLRATVADEAPAEDTLLLYEAWARGDVHTLEALVSEGLGKPSDAVYDRLLTRRNRLWVEVLVDMLGETGPPVFVVVGAAHLVGEQSVIAMLAEQGYQARRLTSVAGLE